MSAANHDRAGVVHAAGAIPWRERDGRLEVALVHRPRYKDWSWPKGKLEPGESLPGAAVREVHEETGTPIVLGVPLPGLRYTASGRPKQVHYWAARVAQDDDAPALRARGPVTVAGTDEIDDVVWVSESTAAELLTRSADQAPLAVLSKLRNRGRLETRTIAVVRHGRARRRSAWSGGEVTRPLTPQGVAQSAALVPVLAAFGIREVLTSPWRRCLDSVGPYAQAAGIRAVTDEWLTEAAHEKDPARSAELVLQLLSHPREAAVSTHRPVLPDIMDAVAEASRRWTQGTIPDRDPYLRTGEALVAHVTGQGAKARVVAVERHRPSSAL